MAVPRTEGIAFRVERRFASSREDVFRAWTDPEALRSWWCPSGWVPAEIHVDLRIGGAFRIGMRRVDGGETVAVHGRFIDVSPPERLAYTFRWENAFEEIEETQVTVLFISDGAGTILSLRHERLPEIPICLRHRAGWIAALDRMARLS